MKETLAIIVISACMVGCVTSQEYKELWNSGTVNASMLGQWHGENAMQRHTVGITIVSNAYQICVTTTQHALGREPEFSCSFSFPGRDVQIGTNTFMLCPSLEGAMFAAMTETNLPPYSPMEGEASLLRYTRHEKGFTFQYLNCHMVQKLIDSEVIEGEKSPPPEPNTRSVSTPHVSRFDAATLQQLCGVFNTEVAWHGPIEFRRENREPSTEK